MRLAWLALAFGVAGWLIVIGGNLYAAHLRKDRPPNRRDIFGEGGAGFGGVLAFSLGAITGMVGLLCIAYALIKGERSSLAWVALALSSSLTWPLWLALLASASRRTKSDQK
jgi:hypothetical protein